MAIVTPKTIFYHIPKTGGTFVTKVMEIGIPNTYRVEMAKDSPFNLQFQHITPDDVDAKTKEGRLAFTFIRSPLTWYKSLWYQRTTEEWNFHEYFFDRECKAVDFSGFVENCLRIYPDGVLSRIYKKFLGNNLDKVDFIGRTERLREDLIHVMEKAREEYSQEYILSHEAENVSKKLNQVTFKPGLKRKIINAERWFYERFESYD